MLSGFSKHSLKQSIKTQVFFLHVFALNNEYEKKTIMG